MIPVAWKIAHRHKHRRISYRIAQTTQKYHRGRLRISIRRTSFILCMCAACAYISRKKKTLWLNVVYNPHVRVLKPRSSLLNFFICLSLTGPQATLGSHRSHAVRKIDALLDSPWTGNQIKKWSLSANPTAVNGEVKDTHVQQGKVHQTDKKKTHRKRTVGNQFYLKNCEI